MRRPAVLAIAGTLTTLAEAASLKFLFTFAVVCWRTFYQNAGARVTAGFDVLAGAITSIGLFVRLVATDLPALVFAYWFLSLCSGVRYCSTR